VRREGGKGLDRSFLVEYIIIYTRNSRSGVQEKGRERENFELLGSVE